MTRLNDNLREWAADAPPLGDIAARAMAQSRLRRRRVWTRTVPLAAAAVLTTVAVLIAGLWGTWIGGDRNGLPVVNGARWEKIPAPARPPAPLPADGVGPAVAGYVPGCSNAVGQAAWLRCLGWRLVTADGRQWQVTNAYPPSEWMHMRDDVGALAVSPDGEQIAYIRKDRVLVVRDLASGTVRDVLTVRKRVLAYARIDLSWSPDGRWLAMDYFPVNLPPDGRHPTDEPAVLIDLQGMDLTRLPLGCCVLGLPEGGQPVPLYAAYGPRGMPDTIRLVGRGRQSSVRVPVRYANGYPYDSTQTVERSVMISPDGQLLARINYDDWTAQLIDVRTGKTIVRHALVSELDQSGPGERSGYPTIYAWRDARTIIVGLNQRFYTVDVRTGTTRQLLKFVRGGPIRVSFAAHLR